MGIYTNTKILKQRTMDICTSRHRQACEIKRCYTKALTGLLLCLVSPMLRAQLPDSLLPRLATTKLLAVGEAHFMPATTSSCQIELIKQLSDVGHDSLIIALELSPSLVYYIREYYKSGNDSLVNSMVLQSAAGVLIDRLKQNNITIPIHWHSLDLPLRTNVAFTRGFLSNCISADLAASSQHAASLKRELRPKKIVRLAREIVESSALQTTYKNGMDSEEFQLFMLEMKGLASHGFIRDPMTKRNNRIRDYWMSKQVGVLVQRSIPVMALVGRMHLVPESAGALPPFLQGEAGLNRTEIMLLPILYDALPTLGFQKRRYPRYAPLEDLVRMGVYDAIFSNCAR